MDLDDKSLKEAVAQRNAYIAVFFVVVVGVNELFNVHRPFLANADFDAEQNFDKAFVRFLVFADILVLDVVKRVFFTSKSSCQTRKNKNCFFDIVGQRVSKSCLLIGMEFFCHLYQDFEVFVTLVARHIKMRIFVHTVLVFISQILPMRNNRGNSSR